ncbi:uncharacterized protein LY79DRAFT_562858 [Colletotrichum navitas]|uniref:Uncharacterized protein n=1 Tax=Colletotrichum navitas TaxID=681940 RepID=A0AAD8PST0_9PEZI|nr:uncharacterized protein LY79DRAFT_562858 [Colletotrichum navitas]KAK1579926.1 hypothetical protein LY79DRAFT_562858 [Colletotrichum navitas]
MDRREQDNNTRHIRRKQVPSYVQPLAYDEALLLSSAQNHVFNWDPEREARGQSHELRNIDPGRGSQTQLTSATSETGYKLLKTSSYKETKRRTPRRLSRRGWYLLQGWWQEIVWCIISIICIVVLVMVLKSYDNEPLPNWPLGLTLNTVVAFIATFCRTSFVLPVVESLSQYKWNWYKSPRPLRDFGAFDEASRGPWGSLKLLLTTKGRPVGILSAAILVSAIATSTLTQSVVTYPTHSVQLPGNDSALTLRNEGYFWVTANSNARRDLMFPINQIIPRSLNTPPEEAMPYHQASCRTNNCTWPPFTSLAVCVDMKNVTDLLTSAGGPYGQPINTTLPNGVFLQHTSGYATMNISTGPSLTFNDTDIMTAKLFHFFVLYGPRLRATEIIMHWCVNTYRVNVQENVPVTERVASHTTRSSGEVFIKNYNQTMNQTYFTSPDSPNERYYVGGDGPDEIASVLESTLVGTSSDLGQYRYGNGCEIYVTALSRAQIGINTANESQKLDDAQFTTLRNLTENIASGLTNA